MKSTSGIFIYFLPAWEKENVTRQKLLGSPVALAFSDALRNERNYSEFVSVSNVAVGPTGTSGVCLACVPPNWPNPHRIGYHPDEQEWVNCGVFWLGTVKHCRPTPSSLQREKLVSGYEVELGDGNVWFAPTIRQWDADDQTITANLPMNIGIQPDGKFAASICRDVAWAWDLACSMLDKSSTIVDRLQAATKFIGLNYRIGDHEANALGLFDTANVVTVIEAALDGPAVERWVNLEAEKKNQQTAGQ